MDTIERKEIISGEELLRRLREVDWSKMLQKLHYYSLNRLQRFPVLAERFNINALATQLADESIKQLWTEERAWDIIKYPDVYQFLKSALDSIRYNFLKSKNVSVTTYLSEEHEDSIAGHIADPESILIDKEIRLQINKLFDGVEVELQVFDCIINNIPPREISKEIGVPVKEVYNIIKRVNRKIDSFRNSYK